MPIRKTTTTQRQSRKLKRKTISFMRLRDCIETDIISSDKQTNQAIAQGYARSGLSGIGFDKQELRLLES